MKRRICFLLAAALLLALPPWLAARAAVPAEESAHRGYIVKLRDDAALPLALPDGAEGLGFGLYAVDTADQAEALAGAGAVEFIEPNYIRRLFDGGLVNDPYYTDGSQWNLDAMGLGPLWALTDARGGPLTGAGVTVAVLDTGLAATHEDLPAQRICDGYNAVDGSGDTADIQSHGTFVSGIIAAQADNALGTAGVACSAALLPCVVCRQVAGGIVAEDADIIRAISWAADHGADVINLSLGSPEYSAATEAAIDGAVERGVIVVAAVGNDRSARLNYPAGYASVVGVGALGEVADLSAADYQLADKEKWAQYSNHNASVTVTAPGTAICGPLLDDAGQSAYGFLSGTSCAAPCVSGLAALCKQYDPDITAGEFKNLLSLTADDRGETGWDAYYGYGAVDGQRMAAALPRRRITYELNGGAWETQPQCDSFRVYQDEDVALGVPVREGYTFAGWYRDGDLSGQPETEVPLPALEDDLTFHALWRVQEPGPSPSAAPSEEPSPAPSAEPSEEPSPAPSVEPSEEPDPAPSAAPSEGPSPAPSVEPSEEPDPAPSEEPSKEPSPAPSVEPSEETDPAPSAEPSEEPSPAPSAEPSEEPNQAPSAEPSEEPDPAPSEEPSKEPSPAPGAEPSEEPSPAPSAEPPAGPAPSPRRASSTGRGGTYRSAALDPSPAPARETARETARSGGSGYIDVSGHWAEESITFLSARGLTRGVGQDRFAPNGAATWAAALTVLARLDGAELADGVGWDESALAWAEARGLSTGAGAGDAMTREELVTLLWRWAGTPRAGEPRGFADVAEVSPGARQAVAWALETGLLQGRPGARLAPKTPATRAELSTLLHRLITAP